MTVTPLKVLVFDIETAPGEVYAFSPKIRYAPYSVWKRYPFMLQWSAARLDGGPVIADTVNAEEVRNRDDARIVQSAVTQIQQADIVLAHNGDQFDIPWVRGRAWLNGTEPLGPVASIDTRKLSARDFGLPHNNLDALIDQKLGRRKLKTDFTWWSGIIESAESHEDDRCELLLRKMLRYCKKDTRDLRDLFQTMIPHVDRLPRMVDSTDSMICPYCGSTSLQKRGKRRTGAFTYQRYQCGNCGRYPPDKRHDGSNLNNLRQQ